MVGDSRTRGPILRIRGRPFRTEVRRHFFTQRVVSLWNSLPQGVIDAQNVECIQEAAGHSTWGKWDHRLLGKSRIRLLS